MGKVWHFNEPIPRETRYKLITLCMALLCSGFFILISIIKHQGMRKVQPHGESCLYVCVCVNAVIKSSQISIVLIYRNYADDVRSSGRMVISIVDCHIGRKCTSAQFVRVVSPVPCGHHVDTMCGFLYIGLSG